jgi:hypothetical protein
MYRRPPLYSQIVSVDKQVYTLQRIYGAMIWMHACVCVCVFYHFVLLGNAWTNWSASSWTIHHFAYFVRLTTALQKHITLANCWCNLFHFFQAIGYFFCDGPDSITEINRSWSFTIYYTYWYTFKHGCNIRKCLRKKVFIVIYLLEPWILRLLPLAKMFAEMILIFLWFQATCQLLLSLQLNETNTFLTSLYSDWLSSSRENVKQQICTVPNVGNKKYILENK